MEQESQVNHTLVSRNLASTHLKEVGFQIPLVNCCKESVLLLKNAFHFYG